MMKRILCAGLALADIPIHPVSPQVFAKDSVQINPPQVQTGGDALNQAVVLNRLGVDCALSCQVGSDLWGDCVVSALRAEGIRTDFVERVSVPTSASVILIQPDGERHFLTSQGASSLYALRPQSAMSAFDIISIASLWGLPGMTLDVIAELRRFAQAHSIQIACDFTEDLKGMGNPYIQRAIPMIDILFPSYGEGVAITGERRPEAILRALAALGPRHIVLKLGADGCLAFVDGKFYRQPSLAAQVLDTTGAGDNFVAAYLACMTRDLSVAQSLEIASRAAARCVAEIGATTARYRFEDLL